MKELNLKDLEQVGGGRFFSKFAKWAGIGTTAAAGVIVGISIGIAIA